MAWTYEQLKTAVNALSPAMANLTDAATRINAQTTTASSLASVADMHGILMLSSTSDWVRIEQRAAQSLSSGWPGSPVAADAPIAVAKAAVSLVSSQVTQVQATDWANFTTALGVLVTSGDISAASHTAIGSLGTATVPMWSPPVSTGDIQTALAQP